MCRLFYIMHLSNVKWSFMSYRCSHKFSWIQSSWNALLTTEGRGSSLWRLSRFWWHNVLSFWQPAVQPTRWGCRFWQSFVFHWLPYNLKWAHIYQGPRDSGSTLMIYVFISDTFLSFIIILLLICMIYAYDSGHICFIVTYFTLYHRRTI